ncbi:MAG TPA: exo-beta-N-acetylmuramidase NamZ domain-containing protein, partial [Bryobacteraceae bacterium]|nr:exo-beta-N-acetylmuramidase NamZ domain-containing protein [Bryobacteraceae bacterium]
MRVAALFLLATLLGAQDAIAPSPKVLETFAGAQAMDNTIQEAVRADELPGAVVIVGRRNGIVYQKAYGNRSVVPTREPMTLDTIFDIASLTKVVATTTSIAKLVEQGKVRINDPVTKYLPEFQAGRSDITVRQLLTHTSGMRPDVDLKPEWSGYETGIRLALLDKPIAPPNTRYMYSDINFDLLGEIVRRASGKSLPDFAKENIFDPLGMRDTGFQPSPTLRQRIAPTEILPGANEPLRGVVHDPTCRFMGGVAGHAGLFSTAYDLSRFAEMMLGLGERKGVRVLSPLTVRAFTSPQSPQEITAVRGFGWDINSPNSGNRGDLFPIGSYGHTGFTGTSMWIDPATQTYVILLANSVHPHGRLPITPLRGRVANVAAAGLGLDVPLGQDVDYAPTPATAVQPVKTSVPLPPVQLGIDVLAAQNFATLRGKRVALITNHTGVTSDGKRTIDVMLKGGVNLVSLLSPEHGISGTEDHENVGHAKDPVTGLRVWSLYNGPNRRPSDEMLSGVDVLVFDIQDIGARFYTYICTMRNAMEVAAQRNLEFIVLDRPNPINGEVVEGPVLDTEYASFVGCGNLPLRHGMTVGELASLFASEITPAPKLSVVRMNNWQRSLWFDQTGLTWVNPSPNMRSLTAALLYPGLGMLEYWKDYSVGRGTDAPFEQIG